MIQLGTLMLNFETVSHDQGKWEQKKKHRSTHITTKEIPERVTSICENNCDKMIINTSHILKLHKSHSVVSGK